MAQFCVLLYLQDTLSKGLDARRGSDNRRGSDARRRSNATKICVSLLENAVFAYPGVADPRTTNSYSIPFEQRLETICFLLESGYSPREMIFNGDGILLIDQVRAEKSSSEKIGSPSMEYWIKVEELMDTKCKRRSLKTFFRWRKEPE